MRLIGTAGCRSHTYHVFRDPPNTDNLSGYVKTVAPPAEYVPTTDKDIFALACELSYTTGGMEVTRVKVIDWMGTQLYDSLVKPTNKIIDYNAMYEEQ